MDETGEFIVDGHTVRYTITDVLGLGSFGVVHQATAKAWEKSDTEAADSIELAIKSLFIASSHSPESDGQLTKELEVVLKLRHPNLVRYFTTFGRAPRLPNERPTWVIVMEYCTGGNLAKFFDRHQLSRLTRPGLGSAHCYKSGRKFIKQIVSSTSASEINFKSLIVKTGTSAEEIIRFNRRRRDTTRSESLPPNLKAVVFNCLQVNPQNRPSAEQLLAAVRAATYRI
ncbi:hypothetical protein BV898_06053 [Hypsibius exemplaris]|uniref:Protein kinase domain-containing protein n=1 Tax=Hypsibius exemplaris TaxID=2072580 RepID=A0A1W0WY02_HYPEX|nr:hypothetical protein BV898_06053 [Hypsibius exemplaris]